MASRAPTHSLSVPSYPHGGGSSGSKDSFRSRGRNRSGSNSGSNSRDHSVEGRSDNRRGLELRGSGDFRASYHNQYKGPTKKEIERVSWGQQQQMPLDTPVVDSKGRVRGQNWGVGSEGSSTKDLYWRSNLGGVHGRVQGVFPDNEGPVGVGSSTTGYALAIVGDQGRRESGAPQRQESGYVGNQRQENGQDNNLRREKGHGANQRQEMGNGGYEEQGGYGRTSQGGRFRGRPLSIERRGASVPRALSGRDVGVSNEVVFGDTRELQTFGSPRGLSRTIKTPGSFLSPSDEASVPWANNNNAGNARDAKGNSLVVLRDRDPRRSVANENAGGGEGWRKSTSSSNNNKYGLVVHQECNEETHQTSGYEITQLQKKKDPSESSSREGPVQRVQPLLTKNQDRELAVPVPSTSKRGSSYVRKNSFERERVVSGELPVLGPSLSSKGSFGRKNSFDKKKKREEFAQIPVFSPSSEPNVNSKRESSFGKLSRESSNSEQTSKDLASDRDEGWSALKQVPSKGRESASAGMHRTRSTDWYEICLKEEEEEELQALALKNEEDSAVDSHKPTPISVGSFSRTSSMDQKRSEPLVTSPSSARRDIKREMVVRRDATDSAQRNFSSMQRNKDAEGKQGLFTPWNSLQQTVPASKSGSLSAPRPRSLLQQFERGPGELRDNLVKPESPNLSIAGGRQASGRGRRIGNAIDTAESEFWRPERRQSRDYSQTSMRSETLQDSTTGTTGRTMLKQTKEKERVRQSSGEIEKLVPEVVPKRLSRSIRPVVFYRALHEALVGDEEPLPNIIGTCPDMCPGKERLQRERLRDLAVFERVSGDVRKTSKELAVKKFCRTVVASELEQSDVRPLPILWKTQQYLLGLLDDPEFSFDIVHNFLFDRTRAIRQELGMQRILDHQTITIHEEIVRFHILSEHELREQNQKRSQQFDTHLNLQQLSKSLHSLLNLYISLGGDGVHFENEAEFHAYYVLLNLGNHGRFHAEPLSLWFPNVSSHVLEGAAMQFARKALRFYRNNNFVRFFRLVREADYLQACLLELNFDSIRAMALAMLNVSEYKLHPYPLSELAQQLILEENEVDELCRYYGLLTGIENSSQKLCLLAKQAQFVTPEREYVPRHSCPLIDRKRAPSYCIEVKGCNNKM